MTRRVVAWIALVALATMSCSRAVMIPQWQVTSEEYRKPGDYRIRLHGWNEYHARRFSMTDSTIVIEELLQSDDHYKLMRHDMPIVVPLKDVENISVMKTNRSLTTVVLVGVGSIVVFWVWIAASGGIGFE
jgi:hypothetical protein